MAHSFFINTKTQRGMTLLSLLITLAIATTTAGMAASAFSNWVPRQRSLSAMMTFRNIFQLARYQAIHLHTPVRVCALTATKACTRNWSLDVSIAVFIDRNRNQQVDTGDKVLRQINWPSKQGDIRWRASLARRYIEFLPAGNTWQNGTLLYCPQNGDTRYARALVLNHAGRSYEPGDSNGDGIHENRQQQPLVCPL